jgi:dTDP-glucose pyrophosphorylase/predicted transcriptional regulator
MLWEKLLLNPEATILNTLKTITDGAAKIVLIVDDNNKLLGTVTDGDIRRGILEGCALTDPIKKVMNPNPVKSLNHENNKEKLMAIMLKNHIHQLPLVDEKGKVVGLQTIDQLLQSQSRENLVVIMSGGLGKRLQPLTNDRPKPMLVMGGKPLLEINIEKLRLQGFKRFCLTVGYKAEIIKEYFKAGDQWDISIDYIHEEKPLGTAGALSFLNEKETLPIIVINGDLLTTVNFNNLLDFHNQSEAACTVCIREIDCQLPYGVVEIENQCLIGIKEKPVYKYFVNAGMYVINPSLLAHIPKNEYYQMNCFLQDAINKRYQVNAFPLMEYWSDIGQLPDYEKACQAFEEMVL